MAYNATKIRNGIYQLKKSDKKDKNIILIHGLSGDSAFNTSSDQMKKFYEHIENDPLIKDYNVWTIVYNTWEIPFYYSGSWLYAEFTKIPDYKFFDAIIVGYSMGGLIARTLAANGFNFKYLITVDTPHLGPSVSINTVINIGNLLPPFSIKQGLISLAAGSYSHDFIDKSPLDIQKRAGNYAYYAIDYINDDENNFHGDDWVVPVNSQLALSLGEVKWRYLLKKEFKKDDPDKGMGKPHTIAIEPDYCQEAINLLKIILKTGIMPSLSLGEIPSNSTQDLLPNEPYLADVNITDVSMWYFIANNNLPYLKLKATIENKLTKPIAIHLDRLMAGNIGRFYSQDEKNNILMLTPKSKRALLMKRDQFNSEIQPEIASLFINGVNKELPLYYVPLPLSESSVMPTESIWSLEIKNESAKMNPKNSKTEIEVNFTIVNPTNLTYNLKTYSIIGKIDSSDNIGDLGINGDVFTWIAENRFKAIQPNADTTVKLFFNFGNGDNNKPVKFSLTLGSKMIPAVEKEITITYS
jgi:pimeloyl-ACP methyl ester carboxylesterase